MRTQDPAILLAAQDEETTAREAALARDLERIIEATTGASTDDEHDPEGATIGFERAQVAALLDQARRHRADLDRALDRLLAGAYGTCETCGESIAPARLQVRPAASTCIGCAGRRQ